jgi:hypothetical protein
MSQPSWNPSGSKHVRPETRLLQQLILQRRAENVPFPDIAAEVNRSQGYIYKMYLKAMKTIIKEPVERAVKLEELKLDNLERHLQQILQATYPLVSGGRIVKEHYVDGQGNPILDEKGQPLVRVIEDPTPKLAAINGLLKVQERRARLKGLDKPTKTAITDPTGEREASQTVFYLPSNGREEAIDVTPQSVVIESP